MAVWHLLALSKESGRGGGRPPFFAPFLAKSSQPRCGTPGLCTEAANSVVKCCEFGTCACMQLQKLFSAWHGRS